MYPGQLSETFGKFGNGNRLILKSNSITFIIHDDVSTRLNLIAPEITNCQYSYFHSSLSQFI